MQEFSKPVFQCLSAYPLHFPHTTSKVMAPISQPPPQPSFLLCINIYGFQNPFFFFYDFLRKLTQPFKIF